MNDIDHIHDFNKNVNDHLYHLTHAIAKTLKEYYK